MDAIVAKGTVVKAARELIPPVDIPGAVRLPRFDRAALRTASSSSAAMPPLESVVGDLRLVLSEAGPDRIRVLAEYSSAKAEQEVLPISVRTPDERRRGYLLIFRAQEPGPWVGAVEVPGVPDWADVYFQGTRRRASLAAPDVKSVDASVRVVADEWVPEWQAVALSRPQSDPVRVAIGKVIRLS